MTRSELYVLVWRLPMRRLGPLLGMSDHGLSKLCHRHDIPVPDRGYWMRAAAGQCVAPTPLPPRAEDETIQRFRALDADGALLNGSTEEHWVIPGMLRASPPAVSNVDVDGLRAALAAAGGPGQARIQRPVPTKQRRPARAKAARPTKRTGDSNAASSTTVDRPGREQAFAPRDAVDFRSEALHAELERMFIIAADHQRRLSTLQLLSAIAVRALAVEPAVARSVLAWVNAMRQGLAADDPVERLISEFRADRGLASKGSRLDVTAAS